MFDNISLLIFPPLNPVDHFDIMIDHIQREAILRMGRYILERFCILSIRREYCSGDTLSNIKSYNNWALEIERIWRGQGIPLQPGVPEPYIHQTGNDLGIVLPPAFVALYTVVNGFTENNWNPGMFVIWPLERMLQEYAAGEDKDFVGFSDFLICSHIIGFRKDKEGIWKECDPLLAVCATFDEAIELINEDSILVH